MPTTRETADKIVEILVRVLDAQVEIVDESWKHKGHEGAKHGGHFFVNVRSPIFLGKSPLERQRMVFAALGDLMKTEIHALSMKCEPI